MYVLHYNTDIEHPMHPWVSSSAQRLSQTWALFFVTKNFLKSPKCHVRECHDILPCQNFVTQNFSKSPKCHGRKCHGILPCQNFGAKNFSKSPKCHGRECHDILPCQNFGTKILAKSPKCHLRKCHAKVWQADEQTLSLFLAHLLGSGQV